jgi:hypothetical protein
MSAHLDRRHAAFHSARDIVELLVQGRERAYLQYMIDVYRAFDQSGDPLTFVRLAGGQAMGIERRRQFS